jgi:hypothetical protein
VNWRRDIRDTTKRDDGVVKYLRFLTGSVCRNGERLLKNVRVTGSPAYFIVIGDLQSTYWSAADHSSGAAVRIVPIRPVISPLRVNRSFKSKKKTDRDKVFRPRHPTRLTDHNLPHISQQSVHSICHLPTSSVQFNSLNCISITFLPSGLRNCVRNLEVKARPWVCPHTTWLKSADQFHPLRHLCFRFNLEKHMSGYVQSLNL